MSSVAWPPLSSVLEKIEIPDGIHIRSYTAQDTSEIIDLLASWYPAVAPGAEGVHLEETFWRNEVFEPQTNPNGRVYCLLATNSAGIVGFHSFENHSRSNHQNVRLTALGPQARGKGLGELFVTIWEEIARSMKIGMLWGTATLDHPGTQKIFERREWKLCGIIPAFDRDLILSVGQVMYVTEAVYCKLLVDSSEIQELNAQALRPACVTSLDFWGI